MSAWDAYITNMKASGLQLAGIFGLEGGQWAKSPELNASQQDVLNIVSGIKSKNFPNGVHLGGVKYTVITYTDDSLTAKCRAENVDASQKYLVHVSLAKTCLVIGGIAGAAERSTTKIVEDLRDYLAKANY